MLIVLLASLGGCAGGVAVPGGGVDDPANPAAPAGDMPAVSQTLVVPDGPATMPVEAGKRTEGGHQHHAH
jgi:hypothetical protein